MIANDLQAGVGNDDADDAQEILLEGDDIMRHNIVAGGGERAATYPISVPHRALYESTDIVVHLEGVWKALSVQLLNSFVDNCNHTAFTVWCYDVESGKEWYAPFSYYNDFNDICNALIQFQC